MGRLVTWLSPPVIVATVLGGEVVHARFIGHYRIAAEPRFAWVIVLIVLLWTTTYAVGVNESTGSNASHLLRSTVAVGVALAFVGVIQLVARRPLLPLFVLGVCVVALVPALALLGVTAERSRTRVGELTRVVALVGGAESLRLSREVARAPELPALLALVVQPSEALSTADEAYPLETMVHRHRATLIVLDREAQSIDEIVGQAARLHRAGVRIRTLSLFYDEWLGRLPVSELERFALLFDINEIHRPVYARTKRLVDVALGAAGMVLVVLAIPLVGLADLLGNRGPLLYRQVRVGKDGVRFTILKFRTMTPGDDVSDSTARGDSRLNGVGRFLRRLHIDELPQMWNVLRRDLSIVGPRPEQPHYAAQFSEQFPYYDTRHLVRPGITGWAQVKSGHETDGTDVLEKLQYDLYYLRHQSIGLDLRIMGRTLRSVVRRRSGHKAPYPS